MDEANAHSGRGPRRYILQWHITHRCNLACAHCYQKDDTCCADHDTLIDTLDKYGRFLNKNGYYGHIYLTGGEPLTHPSFYELLREIRKRKMLLCILTNGTLIDSYAANRIAFSLPEFVQVSLDGTREIHDAIRGRGSFDAALRGIDALTEQSVPVVVSFTAQKNNLQSFPELAKICEKHHVRKLWWDRVVTDTPESAAALALSTPEFRDLCRQAQRLRRRYRRKDGSSLISCERSLQFLGCRRPDVCYTCHAGQDMTTILADGSVMPCRRLPFSIGNIREAELDEIFAGSDLLQQLRNAPIPPECSGCAFEQCCRGGAKCVTYGQTGELFSRDVNCYYREK